MRPKEGVVAVELYFGALFARSNNALMCARGTDSHSMLDTHVYHACRL